MTVYQALKYAKKHDLAVKFSYQRLTDMMTLCVSGKVIQVTQGYVTLQGDTKVYKCNLLTVSDVEVREC